MEKHFRILGYLFIAWGVLLLLAVTFIPMIPSVVRAQPGFAYSVSAFVFAAVIAAFYIFTGWSVLTMQPYARGLTIAASIIALFNFPLGTALGIYGLWVAFSEAGRRVWGHPTGLGSI